MVYVNNGQVHQSQPWGLSRVVRMIDGVVMFFVLFFKTLIGLDSNSSKQSSSGFWGSFRSGGGGGGGGGGGSGGRPNGPGGGGPRFRSMRDINRPAVYGAGCPGGSCGL